jgi:hypothetical protein
MWQLQYLCVERALWSTVALTACHKGTVVRSCLHMLHTGGERETGKPLPNKDGQLHRDPPPHQRLGTSMADVRAQRTDSSCHFQFFSAPHNNRLASIKGAGDKRRGLRCVSHQHPHWSTPSYRVTIMMLIPAVVTFPQGSPFWSAHILVSSRNSSQMVSLMCRGSSVDKATCHGAARLGFDSRQKQGFFSWWAQSLLVNSLQMWIVDSYFVVASSPFASTPTHIQWMWGNNKTAEAWRQPSPPSSTDTKNVWSFTAMSPTPHGHFQVTTLYRHIFMFEHTANHDSGILTFKVASICG